MNEMMIKEILSQLLSIGFAGMFLGGGVCFIIIQFDYFFTSVLSMMKGR